MQRFTYLLLIAVLLGSCSSFGQSSDQTGGDLLNQAIQANSRREHKKAYELLKQIWEDSEQPIKDRAEVGRMLATMDWRFYGENKRAHSRVDDLTDMDFEKSLAFIVKARIFHHEQRLDEAVGWSKKAMELAETETEEYRSVMAYTNYVLELAQEEIFDNGNVTTSSLKEVKNAYSILEDWMQQKLGDALVARLYLGYSLILEKGDEAFRGWKVFYGVTEVEDIHPSLLKSPETFKRALKNYEQGRRDAQHAEIIIKGLADSGLYEYAALMKTLNFGKEITPDERINEIVDYYQFIKSLEQVSREYYLQTIEGKPDRSGFNSKVKSASEELWKKLKWESEKPKFSNTLFRSTIRTRFKSLMTRFSANGYYGLHMGHIMLDDTRTISQYDQKADFRYQVIDNMVSNGYTSWYGDGDNEVGGWAPGDGSFLQVRTALNKAPVDIWTMASDSAEVRSLRERIERFTKTDDDLARANPYSFLPGLKWRLMYTEINKVIDSLRAEGLENEYLRFGFITAIGRMFQGSAIYAHEGRHAIDQKNNYSSSSAELEYTAKLSEIYFAEIPRLAIHSVLQPNMGSSTSHGQANLRVIRGIVDWMTDHIDQIKDFDYNRPVMPQMDKLTNSQLRAAVKSLDPMAK